MPSPVSLSFPLLAKELLEGSARARTYWIRSVYALAMFAAFGVCHLVQLGQRGSSAGLGMLGRGGELFDALIVAQLAGVWLVMPALCAGAFAREKERGTLVLLLLTPMTPWDLVLQKWLSRQIVMSWGLPSSSP